MGGRDRRLSCSHRSCGARGAAEAEGRHPVRARECRPLRRGAEGDGDRHRDRGRSGSHRWAEADPDGGSRLLRPGRALQPRRLRAHDRHHRAGGGGQAHRRVLAAAAGRRHQSGNPLHPRPVWRGRHSEPRRRTGDCRHGVRALRPAEGRNPRRPRQPVRRRGEAHSLRPGRHRHVRRSDRVARDRRRRRRSRHRRRRPRRPSRARLQLSGLAHLARRRPRLRGGASRPATDRRPSRAERQQRCCGLARLRRNRRR